MRLTGIVRRIADRPAAAVVRPLVGGEEAAVGQEEQTVGVAQAPGEQLQRASIGVAAHHGGGAGKPCANALSRRGPLPEGCEGARGDARFWIVDPMLDMAAAKRFARPSQSGG